ncbi:MAG: ATP-dependent Clp protease ATP-binding subunit [Acutalibacteraceae bacterium]|nr:ATP-dependent Clp protease ATP-binding subunit [Acutalibacteraceae bacterium]
MLCVKCKKRPAVIFVSTDKPGDNTNGYCIKCAREAGIKPLDNILNKMGITDNQIDELSESINDLFGEDGEMNLSKMMNDFADSDLFKMTADDDSDDENEDDDDFAHGAPTLPFMKTFFSRDRSDESEKSDTSKDNKSSQAGESSKKKKMPAKKMKHLNAYCDNLNQKVKDGKLDRIIGREKEITRVIQILCRRTKNNPCLIGEPGVGKTAIAEGLAQRIVAGEVPRKLKDKEIFLLDLTSLIAGTQFRGQFEQRIKGLMAEVKEHGNVILFIDEIHNLVGAGGDSEGTMNAANIMKPALSRGEIQVIGATTYNEYRKFIEKDAALERRFQPVTVVEPSISDTIEMLEGVKCYYEEYHKVEVTDKIVRRAVIVSERYITDRFLPDKAIDLLDEACVNASLKNKDADKYYSLKNDYEALLAEESEIANADSIDYERLSIIRTDIKRLEKKLSAYDPEKMKVTVTEEDVAKVVELWTGIPASKIQENELKRLADLDQKLKTKIIGQDKAVEALASAIRRSRVQISPRRHPASFIFVGPTGVGKTELVKVMSQELFDSPETLIRLDMSEFMEKHSVSKIIGSPPGYVGYDEAGQVTEKVRRRPYSVLLFDEIEKAHPDVLNILLQILDEGRLTDAHGRVVNFENTVIVMTSNAGSDAKEGIVGFNKSASQLSEEKTMKALSNFLRPEFIARVDEIIHFNVLSEDNYKDIARLMLNEYVGSLKEKGITFTYDDNAVNYLADHSCGGKSGARDLRNFIRKEVEDAVTNEIVYHGEGAFTKINVTEKDGKIMLETD